MTKFEKELIRLINTDLNYWYNYELDCSLINPMKDSNKQKFGRVAEKAVEILTGSKKTSIKDFEEGEIKTVSLTEGSRNFLKDSNDNLLTYKCNSTQPYIKLKPYGDNFIMPYSDDLTWYKFHTKIEKMYFIFYEKYQPEGPSQVDEAKVVNILKFESKWNKKLKNEFELIQTIGNSTDLHDAKVCKEAQKYVRESNDLLIMKRFNNGNRYEWQLFFKDKEIIKHGQFLIDYKKIKSFDEIYEDGDEAEEYVYYIASNGNKKVMKKYYKNKSKVRNDFFSEINKNIKSKPKKNKSLKKSNDIKSEVTVPKSVTKSTATIDSHILLKGSDVFIIINNNEIKVTDVDLAVELKVETLRELISLSKK